jgi:multimeric flavodoxin WrbA
LQKNPANYDLVVIGTPVWFWSLSSPMRSWMEQNVVRRGRVAFFCTMGGSGARRVFATMARLIDRQPVATLALTDAQVDSHVEDRLAAFADTLKKRQAARGARTQARRRAARPAAAAV